MIQCIDCISSANQHKSHYRHLTRPGMPEVDSCPMPPPIAAGEYWVEAPPRRGGSRKWITRFAPPIAAFEPVISRYGPFCEKHRDRCMDALSRGGDAP